MKLTNQMKLTNLLWTREAHRLLWWRVLIVDKSTDHPKPHSICFLPQHKKKTKKSLSRLGLESVCVALNYLYASDFPFKKFCKLAQHAETWEKNVWEKSNDLCLLQPRSQGLWETLGMRLCSLWIRAQTMLNQILICFLSGNPCKFDCDVYPQGEDFDHLIFQLQRAEEK